MVKQWLDKAQVELRMQNPEACAEDVYRMSKSALRFMLLSRAARAPATPTDTHIWSVTYPQFNTAHRHGRFRRVFYHILAVFDLAT